MGRKNKLKADRKKDKVYQAKLKLRTVKPIQDRIDEFKEQYQGYKDADRLIYPQLVEVKEKPKPSVLDILSR